MRVACVAAKKTHPGRDADAAHLRRQRIGQVVAVQVQRRDHVEVLRTGEHLAPAVTDVS
jgi:hypothetical protein